MTGYYLEHIQTNRNENENVSHLKPISTGNTVESLEGYVLPYSHNYLALLNDEFEENRYHSIPYNNSVSNPLNNTVSKLALY